MKSEESLYVKSEDNRVGRHFSSMWDMRNLHLL